MGLQRVRHDWVIKQQQDLKDMKIIFEKWNTTRSYVMDRNGHFGQRNMV